MEIFKKSISLPVNNAEARNHLNGLFFKKDSKKYKNLIK